MLCRKMTSLARVTSRSNSKIMTAFMKRDFLVKGLAISALCFLFGVKSAKTDPQPDKDWEEITKKVQYMLSRYSAMPVVTPLLPASQAETRNLRWEDYYKNGLGLMYREIADPERDAEQPVSIYTDIVDYESGHVSLPARSCPLIVTGKVILAESRLAKNRHLVYSSYTLSVEEVLKGKASSSMSLELLQFGGAIRFPSNHVQFFIRQRAGFLGEGHRYVVFLWKPVHQMDAYTIALAYLLSDDGHVHPIDDQVTLSETDAVSLKNKILSAVKANVDR